MFSYWANGFKLHVVLIFIYYCAIGVQGRVKYAECRINQRDGCIINIDNQGDIEARPINNNPAISTTYTDYRINATANDNGNSQKYRILFSEDYCTAVHAARHIEGDKLTESIWTEEPNPYDGSECCPHLVDSKNYFNLENQIESFNIQFEGTQDYITKHNPLVPSEMMPRFFLGTNAWNMVAVTSCYNMVPLFKSVHNGNWRKTLTKLREWYMYGDDHNDYQTNIVRGGSLTLPGSQGTVLHVNAWRNENGRVHTRLPIPEYLAAVIVRHTDNYGYVYVTFNNPFINKDAAEKRAKEICSEPVTNWYKSVGWDLDDKTQGYSFMCKVKEFFEKSKIPYPDVFKFEEVDKVLWRE